uniref:(California timema) hypothetical protein n=1 Tax=Timema californicum TaxID=61474 RepID=A0A7R9P4K0_TIMCA|nr:unnamed protein product [Timema californicum]
MIYWALEVPTSLEDLYLLEIVLWLRSAILNHQIFSPFIMVVGAFPIAKLGTLLLRQISKPIANIAKEKAKQIYNWCEIKSKMWIMNLGKPVSVPSLNEAMAIELGANLLGEGIIFIVAAGVIFLEYARSSRKEAAKEAALKDELSTLSYTIQELYFQTEKQDAQIRELLRAVSELQGSVVQKPWSKIRKTSDPFEDPLDTPSLPTMPAPSLPSSQGPVQQPSLSVTRDEMPKASFLVEALNYIERDVKGYR